MDSLKWIPQMFFDVIARVMPGCATLLGLCIASWPDFADRVKSVLVAESTRCGDGSVVTRAPSTWAYVIGVFAASYAVGHVMSPLAEGFERWLIRRAYRCNWEHGFCAHFNLFVRLMGRDNKPVTRACFLSRLWLHLKLHLKSPAESKVRTDDRYVDSLITRLKYATGFMPGTEPDENTDQGSTQQTSVDSWPGCKSVESADALMFLMFERIRVYNADIGGRLTKLRAEYHMQAGFAVAAMLTVVWHVIVLATSRWWYGIPALNWWLLIDALNWRLMIGSIVILALSLLGLARAYQLFQYALINVALAKSIGPLPWDKEPQLAKKTVTSEKASSDRP